MTKEKPTSFEQQIEDKIVEKGLTAPRVTKAHVGGLFGKLEFIQGKVAENRIMCTAYLDGFGIADGFSACVDPANFDEEIGVSIAVKNCKVKAYEKLWELEGYRLSRTLAEAAQSEQKPTIIT